MRALTFLLTALAVATPALAQDGSEIRTERTIAGAHAFIDELFQNSGAYIGYQVGEFYALNGYGKPLKRTDPLYVEADVVGIDTPVECRTVIRINPASARPWFQTRQKWSVVNSFEIDWRNIGPVRGFTAGLFFQTSLSVDREIRLGFKTQNSEIANRLVFAAEFLREKCQLQSKTGF